MTPAELRTAHDALGLTADFLAERAGLHVNMIWRYEHTSRKGDVPVDVAITVRALSVEMDAAADRLADELAEEEELPRYVAAEDYWMAVPELDGWPRESQGILLAEVQRLMRARGVASPPPIRYR